MSRTMRRATQKEGQDNLVGAKNETLCAGLRVVRVFLFNDGKTRFNPKVGFQVQVFQVLGFTVSGLVVFRFRVV